MYCRLIPASLLWATLVLAGLSADGVIGGSVGGPKHADGTEVACDLPGELHQKNTGGSDGAGLCVFASMRHAGLFQNEPVFASLFDYMRKFPGGGYPEKVDRMIAQYCQETGKTLPDYIQVENNDLEILKLACKSGRIPGVTYSFSPTGRYNGQRISHMVSLVHADDGHFVILDNNHPGPDKYEWLSPQEFLRTYSGRLRGWSVILLSPPPPPPPRN